MENFSTQWFLAFYLSLGALLLSYGIYLLVKTAATRDFLILSAGEPKPPVVWRKVLKYLFLFTLPGVVLSFFPFSWIELVFCFWSLIILYIAAAQLVRWKQSRLLIKRNQATIADIIRKSGAIMLSVGFAIFLLAYLVVKRTIE